MIKYPNPALGPEAQDPDVLLALTILGEAEGEGAEGKVAVAHVVKNRMDKNNKTVSEVVLAPWQFSCWNNGTNRREFLLKTIEREARTVGVSVWAACYSAATEALENLSQDPTGGATHYCVNTLWESGSNTKKPKWFSKEAVASGITEYKTTIGSHTFAQTA